MSVTAIGLGSNLGNRLMNLRTAFRLLAETLHCAAEKRLIRASDVFETEPWGVTDQPYFLNACLTTESALPPEELLLRVKRIEADMGREVTRRWGERKIDIDVLFMGSTIYESPTLRVPHPEMHRRDFVLIPLAQISPRWVHPVTKRAVSDMAFDFQGKNPTRICSITN
jgi:2-amino-4-hydroxy-6-hydroxymethyldihydropteridine diphosphokinase